MRESVKQVIDLRKQGKTYKQIAEATGRTKGTISWVCKKYLPLESAKVEESNRSAAWKSRKEEHLAVMRSRAKEHYRQAKTDNIAEFSRRLAKIDRVFVSYIAGLYDGEGRHSGTEFRLSNSSKVIVNTFLRFLRDIQCDVNCTLYLHSTHDENTCKTWWGIPFDAVYSYGNMPQAKASRNEVTENYGTACIRVSKNSNGLREALASYSIVKSVANDGFDPSTSACNADVIASSPVG